MIRLLVIATALATSVLPAQVPAGHIVVSSYRWNTVGGLAIVHPTIPGAATMVTGLSDQLTGAGISWPQGAYRVAHAADGFLLVGEISRGDKPIEIREVLVVNGVAVQEVATYVGVGNGSESYAVIRGIAPLENGDAIFAVEHLANTPPLNGAGFGYFDRSQRVITPIPIPVSGAAWGLAVDESAGEIYFHIYDAGSLTSDVWSAPIHGGAPNLVATIPAPAWGVELDEAGNPMIVRHNTIRTYDKQSGQTLEVEPFPGGPTVGVSIERATATTIALSGYPGEVYRSGSSGPILLAQIPSGSVSGVAVANSTREYGAATTGSTEYAIRTFPGVGGVPIAGNSNHAFQVDAADGSSPLGILAISYGAADFPALGVQVLVDPVNAATFGPFVTGAPIAFPIPQGLPSTTVYVQAFALDASNPSGLATSRGVQLTTIE